MHFQNLGRGDILNAKSDHVSEMNTTCIEVKSRQEAEEENPFPTRRTVLAVLDIVSEFVAKGLHLVRPRAALSLPDRQIYNYAEHVTRGVMNKATRQYPIVYGREWGGNQSAIAWPSCFAHTAPLFL